ARAGALRGARNRLEYRLPDAVRTTPLGVQRRADGCRARPSLPAGERVRRRGRAGRYGLLRRGQAENPAGAGTGPGSARGGPVLPVRSGGRPSPHTVQPGADRPSTCPPTPAAVRGNRGGRALSALSRHRLCVGCTGTAGMGGLGLWRGDLACRTRMAAFPTAAEARAHTRSRGALSTGYRLAGMPRYATIRPSVP